jgi:hypothetical protein
MFQKFFDELDIEKFKAWEKIIKMLIYSWWNGKYIVGREIEKCQNRNTM